MSELLQKHYPKEILKPRSSSEGVPSISVAVSEEGGVGWRCTLSQMFLLFPFFRVSHDCPHFLWH